MTTLPNVNLTSGRLYTADELEAFWNNIIAVVNSLPATNLQKTEAGKVQINITGDAATVGGLTAGEIAGADFAVFAKTLAELLVNSGGLVISGGAATKNAGTANQLDITAIIAVQKDADGKLDRVEIGSTNKTTLLAGTTYYLDLVPGAADYSWDTAHATAPYIAIAEVTTDGSGNISTVTNKRPVTLSLFASLLPTSGELELGATETTAYRGDLGAAAYAHSQVVTGDVHGAVSANAAGKMVVRDADARFRANDPSHAQDVATKNYIDGSFSATTGHKHTGAAGDAPNLAKGSVGLGNVDNLKQMPIAGGTFTGAAIAQANTNYTTAQLRNIIISTANPSGGGNGDVWIKYTA